MKIYLMNHRLKFMDCQVRIHLSAVKKRYDFNQLKTKAFLPWMASTEETLFALNFCNFHEYFYIQGTAWAHWKYFTPDSKIFISCSP